MPYVNKVDMERDLDILVKDSIPFLIFPFDKDAKLKLSDDLKVVFRDYEKGDYDSFKKTKATVEADILSMKNDMDSYSEQAINFFNFYQKPLIQAHEDIRQKMEEFTTRIEKVEGINRSYTSQVLKCFKKGDRILLNDVMKRTGLTKVHAKRALKRLRSNNRLLFDKLDNETHGYYHLP